MDKKIIALQERHFRREHLVCLVAVRGFAFVGKVPPPLGGSKNVCQCLTQGLRPGLCRSAALAGLILPFVLCVSRVSYWASPSFHPGLCRSVALAGLIFPFVLCVPRVSSWASPSFRPGLCGSAALAGLFQFQIPSPNPFPCTNISEPTNAQRPQSNPTITLPTTDQAQIRLSLYIIWVWVSPLGRHSCKAQGGESAKGTNRTLGTHG